MATWIWVNIGLGNRLLPDGTNPLPEPMLSYHEVPWHSSKAIVIKWFEDTYQQNNVENAFSKSNLDLPGINELILNDRPRLKSSWYSRMIIQYNE